MKIRQRVMKYRILSSVLFVLCFFSFTILQVTALPAQAATGPQISLRAAVGFQSNYDPSVWVPVRVSVSNAGHQAIAGVLQYVIPSSGSYPYEGALNWPVQIPANGTADVTIGIPGSLLFNGNNPNDSGALVFAKGGQTLAQTRMVGNPVGNSDIAGIVSDHPSAVQFLAGVSSSNGTSELVASLISPSTMPDSTQLLQSLTYLYIDGAAAQELSSSQTASILEWVRAGGILILGGIEPNAGQIGVFSRISPVSATVVIDGSGTLFGSFAGTAMPRGSISQLYGTATADASVLMGTSAHALLATRPLGRGEVAYAGFSASQAELVSWSGNAMFWETLLHQLQHSILPASPDLFGVNGLWSLMGPAELFPQLHTPPLWIWELVFALYLVICGPLLYLLLRRRHKSEWAWLLLPAFSVVLAGAIYEMGLVQRPNGILTQSVGLVDIVDTDEAQLVGMDALLSPQSRSYTVNMPAYAWAIPLAERLTGVAHDGQAYYTKTGRSLAFTNVQAWGGRFVYAERTAHHLGSLTGELFSSGNTVGGYLINHTAMNLSDLGIVLQGQVFYLGSLPRGRAVKVQVTLAAHDNHAPFVSELAVALPSANHGVGRALLDYARQFAGVDAPAGTAILIGWTHDEPRLFSTEGGDLLSATPQWIVRQVFPLEQVVE